MAALRTAFGAKLKPTTRLAMTGSMRQSLNLLAMRTSAIRRYAIDCASQNPYLDLDLPSLPNFPSASPAADFDFGRLDAARHQQVSLVEHIAGQIGTSIKNSDDRSTAYGLLDYLTPAGWLATGAADDLVAAGFDGGQIARVLGVMQGFEPAGVFARSLSECLALQLAERNQLTLAAAAVLDCLGDYLGGGLENLQEKTGLSVDALGAVMANIRGCNPKPGAAFTYETGDIFRPDFMVSFDGDEVTITVNEADLPQISVADSNGNDDAGSKILRAKAHEVARDLRRSIAKRSEMLLLVGGLVANHQVDFIRHGELSIKPLSMASIADKTGHHKSTISRLVADKLVSTPRGMVDFADFFAAGIIQGNGDSIAGRRIAAMVRSMIASESRPLSDTEIQHNLQVEFGIAIARRTAAKYRQAAGILPFHKRQSNFKSTAFFKG